MATQSFGARMAAIRATKKTSVAASKVPKTPVATKSATLSPSMVTAIKKSPKGKLPPGLAKYMANKKTANAAGKKVKLVKRGK